MTRLQQHWQRLPASNAERQKNSGWEANVAYPAWICVIKPSRTHQSLLVLVSSLGGVAILISPVSIVIQLLCLAALIAMTTLQWRKLRQTRVLHHHGGPDDTINQWTLSTNDNQLQLNVYLENEGYRSAGLLMLVFKPDNGRSSFRIPVWFDAVSATQFSYLNAQLMFNTRAKR